ncbi:IclR family transcriptional regulator [Acetobacteraceae bacterium H6797]|nr:IclR family transcriptional regulator [Acetobacteraceae bacterium H6797]
MQEQPQDPKSPSADIDERLFVNAIERAMVVLELFENARQELSLTDIMARASIGRSAVQRFVYTLHHLGYLARNPDNKRYSLGPKVLGLYRGYLGGRSVLQRAQHALLDLNRRTGECVSWAELLETEIVIVENMPSPHLTAVTLMPGMRFEAISASSGQVMLAHAPEEAMARAFAAASTTARARAASPDFASFRALLAQVRGQGYSMTTKAFDQDSLSISAPVLDPQGRPVGAVNLSALASRFSREEALQTLVPAVIAAARACR